MNSAVSCIMHWILISPRLLAKLGQSRQLDAVLQRCIRHHVSLDSPLTAAQHVTSDIVRL